MIATIFKLFGGLGLLARIGIIAGIAAAAYGGYALWRKSIWDDGYETAIEHVAAQNKEANDRVRKRDDRVRACYDAGGVWRQDIRDCDRSVRD